MEINEYMKKWSEKLSLTESEIMDEYNAKIEEEKKLHPELTEQEIKTRALQRISLSYKKQLRSPAVGFEGMIIAAGDCIDTVARQRREAIQFYLDNPQQAIQAGVTDSNGVPLDNRKEWASGQPNRRYGKPLPEHNWLRTIYGIAAKSKTDAAPKYFIMNLNGELAKNETIQLFKPIKFRAIDKSQNDSNYMLNASMFTKFEPTDLQLPEPETIISQFCSEMIVDMSNLPEYHDRVKNDYNHLAIIKGDVSTLILEPTSVGSRRMIIEDESKMLEDLEALGTTCWVPERLKIDFGEQSKVIVLGRTVQGKKLDEQGNQTDEPGDVMINVFGIYALPQYKINPPVEEVTEENAKVMVEDESADISEDSSIPKGGW